MHRRTAASAAAQAAGTRSTVHRGDRCGPRERGKRENSPASATGHLESGSMPFSSPRPRRRCAAGQRRSSGTSRRRAQSHALLSGTTTSTSFTSSSSRRRRRRPNRFGVSPTRRGNAPPPHADVAPSGFSPHRRHAPAPSPSRRRAAARCGPELPRSSLSLGRSDVASCTAPGRGWGGARCDADFLRARSGLARNLRNTLSQVRPCFDGPWRSLFEGLCSARDRFPLPLRALRQRPGRTRTSSTYGSRRLLLYPAELRGPGVRPPGRRRQSGRGPLATGHPRPAGETSGAPSRPARRRRRARPSRRTRLSVSGCPRRCGGPRARRR